LLRTGQNNSKEHTFFKTSVDSAPPPPGRYTPTCSLCGKQHWPLDPSCLGKKGARVRAKEKAEAKRQTKLQAKAERKNRSKAKKDAKNKLKADEKTRSFADKISRIQSEAQEVIEQTEFRTEEKLQTEYQMHEEIQARTEQKIRSYAEEIAKIKSESAQALSKEQQQLQAQIEEKLKIRTEADAAIEKISSALTSTKESLDAEIQSRISVEKKIAVEINKRRQLESAAIEKNRSHNEEMAKLRTETGNAKAASEARLKGKLQDELKLRTKLQAGTGAKIKSLAKQIASLKARAARSQQENEAKAVDGEIDNIEFEENDANRAIDADVSGNMTSRLLEIKARDIMLKKIVWADPDDSVRDVFEKMQESGDHVIIGTDGIAAGLVSKANLKGTACSYLQPLMAKWKYDQNDTSLDIEIKWLMNRQVQTISKDMSCAAIMKKMYRGSGPLPVIDQNNKVVGLVTPFNAFKIRALLKLESVNAQQK